MKIAFVIYRDFTALDLTGPYEIIRRWPDADVHFVSSSMRPVRCDRGLTVLPTDTPATIGQPDLIVVPGSENLLPGLDDRRLIEWLARAAPGCQWTASVCTGAGLYAAAGLLDGRRSPRTGASATTSRAWGSRSPPIASSGTTAASAAPASRRASTWRSL